MSPPGLHGTDGATFVVRGDNAAAARTANFAQRLSGRSQYRETQPEGSPVSKPGRSQVNIPEHTAQGVAR